MRSSLLNHSESWTHLASTGAGTTANSPTAAAYVTHLQHTHKTVVWLHTCQLAPPLPVPTHLTLFISRMFNETVQNPSWCLFLEAAYLPKMSKISCTFTIHEWGTRLFSTLSVNLWGNDTGMSHGGGLTPNWAPSTGCPVGRRRRREDDVINEGQSLINTNIN